MLTNLTIVLTSDKQVNILNFTLAGKTFKAKYIHCSLIIGFNSQKNSHFCKKIFFLIFR